MTKILFWAALIAAAYLAWKFSSRRAQLGGARKPRDARAPMTMIQCPQCGTHFPEDEAVLGDGTPYCSERCRSAARHEKCR